MGRRDTTSAAKGSKFSTSSFDPQNGAGSAISSAEYDATRQVPLHAELC